MARGGRSSGGVLLLLRLSLCVPSASLPSHANKAREIVASGIVTPLDFAAEEAMNVTSHGVLRTADAHFGFEFRGRGKVEPPWKIKAAAPWSFAAPRPSPQSSARHASVSGDLLYQLDAGVAQGVNAVYVGGVPIVLLAVVVPLSCCCFFFLFVLDADDGSFLRNSPKRREERKPASPHPQQTYAPVRSPPQATAGPSPAMQQRISGGTAGSGPQAFTGVSPGAGAGYGPSYGMATTSPNPAARLLPDISRQPAHAALAAGYGPPPPPVFSSPPPSLQPLSSVFLAPPHHLLAPVVEKKTGEVFILKGQVLNVMQANVNVKVTRAETKEPYACIHINENSDGCGVLVEMHPRNACAFFDTQFAVGGGNMGPPQVRILHAGPEGWDPTSEPVAVVSPSFELPDEVIVSSPSSGGVALLQVKLEADGQPSRVMADPDGPRSKVVGMIEECSNKMIEADPSQKGARRLFVHCGVDPVLVLCSVVAAIKIGIQ